MHTSEWIMSHMCHGRCVVYIYIYLYKYIYLQVHHCTRHTCDMTYLSAWRMCEMTFAHVSEACHTCVTRNLLRHVTRVSHITRVWHIGISHVIHIRISHVTLVRHVTRVSHIVWHIVIMWHDFFCDVYDMTYSDESHSCDVWHSCVTHECHTSHMSHVTHDSFWRVTLVSHMCQARELTPIPTPRGWVTGVPQHTWRCAMSHVRAT